MPPLSDRDYELSMRLSPRPRRGGEDDGLRSLLVHRLRGALKLIARITLSEDISSPTARYSIHCEPCDQWFSMREWAEEIACPKCKRVYAVEFAVFTLIENT